MGLFGGGGLLGGITSSIMGGNAARKASNQAIGWNQKGMDSLNEQFDATKTNLSPYQTQGTQGFNILANMLNTGDMSKFFESPQYQFALQQGLKGQQSSAGLRGLSTAPRTAQDLGNYAQKMASGEFQNYVNNMSNLGTMGYNANNQFANLALNSYVPLLMGTYNNMGNLYGQKTMATNQSNQNILGSITDAASMLAMFSDENLKENIVKVDNENGFNIYEYNYKGDNVKYRGVIAQEVQKIKPEAVIQTSKGLAVFYDMIGIKFARA